MGDIPGPGVEPVSLALADGFLTREAPPLNQNFLIDQGKTMYLSFLGALKESLMPVIYFAFYNFLLVF